MKKLRHREVKQLVHSHTIVRPGSFSVRVWSPIGLEKNSILGAVGHPWRIWSRGWLVHLEKDIWVRLECSKLLRVGLCRLLLEFLWELPWMQPCLHHRSIPLIWFASRIPWNNSLEWKITLRWGPAHLSPLARHWLDQLLWPPVFLSLK